MELVSIRQPPREYQTRCRMRYSVEHAEVNRSQQRSGQGEITCSVGETEVSEGVEIFVVSDPRFENRSWLEVAEIESTGSIFDPISFAVSLINSTVSGEAFAVPHSSNSFTLLKNFRLAYQNEAAVSILSREPGLSFALDRGYGEWVIRFSNGNLIYNPQTLHLDQSCYSQSSRLRSADIIRCFSWSAGRAQ